MKHLTLLATALIATPALAATSFTTTIDAATYNGSYGTIIFNDHGYTGPTGVGANDFQVGAGFDSTRIGQIQKVVTKDPDWITPDAPKKIFADGFNPTGAGPFPNANMDAQVNFYKWGYTTVGGSTFSDMQIDKAGNYHVAKSDMAFKFYDSFKYNDGTNPVSTYDTDINFQPYAVSDAKGWCGSVLNSNPNGVAAMGGQVTFDFAFDAYLNNGHPETGDLPSTQIVPGFVMRSYGDYTLDVRTSGGVRQLYTGTAAMNNTNPLTGALDPAWQNQVSFLGAGVVPTGVWVLNDGTKDVQIVAAGTAGATWHQNSFGGYAFMLRADASRTLEFIALDGHSDYVSTDPAAYASIASVPEPDTYAMMAVGLGLVGGMARRRMRA
jgi:hypothetical protein